MLSPLRLDISEISIGSPWPIPIETIKLHCRIDSDDEDLLIERYLRAAILWVESETHRTVLAREHRWVLDRFPCSGFSRIRLPRGRSDAVLGIAYSNGGIVHSLRGPTSGSPAGTDYQEELRGESGALLMPPRGGSWPGIDSDVPSPVVITFMAGWPDDEIPDDIVHAILFWIEDAFEMRGASSSDVNMGPNAKAREVLISSYLLPRVY